MLTPMEAIAELVDYLERDERKHFAEMNLNGEDTRNHILHAVVTVADWLDKQPRPSIP